MTLLCKADLSIGGDSVGTSQFVLVVDCWIVWCISDVLGWPDVAKRLPSCPSRSMLCPMIQGLSIKQSTTGEADLMS